MKSITIIILIVFSFSSCVSYTHLVESGAYNATNKIIESGYFFSGTYTYDIELQLSHYNLVKEKIANGEIKMTDENTKKLEAYKIIKSPTYYELAKYVRDVFGEKATFANVVWDVKHTSFLALNSDKIYYVTFDVYLPKK